MTLSPTDRTKLNNLSPNLAQNQVAVSALRLAVFQEIYEVLDAIINDLNAAQGIGSVTSSKLADGSVLTVKLSDGAVTGPKILDGAIVEMKLANGAVTSVKLADLGVTTAKLANLAVTREKIAAGAVGASQLDGTLLINYGDIATQAEFAQRGINVKWYGAVGDGVADDTTAIINAFASIPTEARAVVYFPPGSYKVTKKITITNKGVTVLGAEKITSAIYFYGCDGFEHTGEYNFTIRDIGLYTNGKTYTAIKIPSRLTLNSFELHDVDMWGFPYGSSNWGIGIHLEDISNTWIYRHTFIGDYTSAPFAAGTAIKIDSTVAKGSTGHHMMDCTWNYAAIAVDIDAKHNISIEGVRIDKCGMVGVIVGVSFDSSTSGYVPPLFTMTSSHIDLKDNGTALILNSVAQVDISGCDLYGFNVNNKLVDIVNCTQVMLGDNFFVAGVAAGTTAVSITNSSAVQIDNNQFNGNWINGLVIDALSTMIFEKNNKYLGAITNKIIDNSGKLFANAANRCVVTRNSSQLLTTDIATKVPWTNSAPNWHSMWSVADPTKLTIPKGVTRIKITGQVRFNTEGTTGVRQIVVLKNNAYSLPLPIVDMQAVSGRETTINFSSGYISVVEGDYVELQAFQNSGVTVSINQGVTYFEVEVIDYYTR